MLKPSLPVDIKIDMACARSQKCETKMLTKTGKTGEHHGHQK